MRLSSLLAAIVAASSLVSPIAIAKGGGSYAYSTGTHGNHATANVPRDFHGHIKRSEQSKDAFKKSHPCPSTGNSSGTCPGYVIDHIVPLKRGGADEPYNMQWQTEAAAKQKDKWE